MNALRALLLTSLVLAASCGVATAGSASVMLQKGIYQEQTAGNLDGAITIYKQIVANADADRPSVAQALYRMGVCYEKKGDRAQAQAAFRKVVAEYADIKTVATRARKRMNSVSTANNKIETQFPTVIRSTPPTLSNDVDPALKSLTVTFDRPMMNKSWSWTGGGDTFPKITGKPFYDATRMTCTVPVALKPGKVYWVGVNSPSHKNFQTIERKPAKRYVMLFATRGTDGKATPISNSLKEVVKDLNAAPVMAVAFQDEIDSNSLNMQGWQLWNQRKFSEAETEFKAAVKKNPSNANAWNGLGWSQFNQGRPGEAEIAFRTCLKYQPDHVAALNGCGWIEKGKGQTIAPIACWMKAVAVNPNATAAISGLAQSFMEMRDYEQAVKYYEMLAKAMPDDANVQAQLEKAKAMLKK